MSLMPSRPSHAGKRCRRFALAAVALAALKAPAQIQPELPTDAKESLQNVTVNDAPEARKDIETARDMERQHQWNKAAGWYQEVLEKYRTRVVAWKADDQNVINRYRGIVYQVQEALAKWPAEGITAYRARYEATAAAMLESAKPGDSGALQAVIDTYFITESAKSAGLKLIDLHMESGEFDAAARVGELLLSWYPADHLIAERPRLIYRTALAHHLCGNAKLARQQADALKDKFADVMGTVFGKDVLLSESLEKMLLVAPAIAAGISPDSWMAFNGSPDRSHVSTAQGHMGARIFSIELPPRPLFKGQDAVANKLRWQQEEADGRTLGIMPVVDAGGLYFQDGARVWAVGLDSGMALPGWVRTHGSKGIYQLKNAPSFRNHQYTLTLTDGAVVGVMGQSYRVQNMYANQGIADFSNGIDSGTRLVCLDRDTGKERWKISMASLGGENVKDDEKERLRALDLSGSPLVVGDNVYDIGRGGKDLQFENCYCLCFDLNSGQYRWSCLVGSAGAAFNMYGNDPSQASSTLSHMAYASGRLYLLTNLGALASIDAANGSIVWLGLYPRDNPPNNNDVNIFGGRRWRGPQQVAPTANLRPWELNPVLAQDGKLIVMPTDGKLLLVYDAANGDELKRINLEDFQGSANVSDRPRTLVSAVGDMVLMVGEHNAYAVNWRLYDPKNPAGFQGNQQQSAARVSALGANVRGRAFATADSLYVTTDKSLYRLRLKQDPLDMLIRQRYPDRTASHDDPWDEKEGPGNIVVTGEHVIIAGKNSIDVFTDMALARTKLDREEAAAPDEPDPRLHYAEVMFAAGQPGVSLEKLNDAARLMGGLEALRSGPGRQRLFNDALTFAQKLARDQEAKSIEAAIQFFDLAGKSADLASEQVNYRLSRAQFVRANVEPNSYAIAVKLYQEILGRPELRDVGVVPEATEALAAEPRGVVQAAVEAEAQIAELIRKHPDAYAAVGQQAIAAMEAARAAGDADKLLAVAQTYPNAPVAPNAMLLAADQYEQSKNPRLATHVLRQIYRKYGETAEKSRIIESMVRNYLNLPGGVEIALARLDREKSFSERKLTRPLVLPGGKTIENVTFREVVAELTANKAEPALAVTPDVHVPFFHRLTDEERAAGKKPPQPFAPGALAIADVAALVQPPLDMLDAVRNDRVTAVVGNQLCIFAPGSDKPLGTVAALTGDPRAGIWTKSADGKSVLIAWSNNEIVALDGDTAALLWSSPLKSLASSELITVAGLRGTEVVNDSVAPNPNVDPDPREVALNARRQRGFGRRNGMPIRAIQVVQPQPPLATDLDAAAPAPEQIGQVQPLSNRLIIGTSTGRLICLDSANGKVAWQTHVSPKPILQLVASEDFTAVKIAEEAATHLIVLDNYNGQIQMVRNFADQNQVPINMVLSPDGMLVWTLPDRLCGKDLYEPDTRKLTFEDPSRIGVNVGNNATYVGCNKPGQLLIRGRQILALEQNGRFVSIHSLEDGKIARHKSGKEEVPSLLSSAASQAMNAQGGEVNIWMRLAGHYLYVIGNRNVVAYHLDHPGDASWTADQAPSVTPGPRVAIPSRDYLIVVGERPPKLAVENATRFYQLRFYSRVPFKGSADDEGGYWAHTFDVGELAGVTAWQAVDGGVYYLSGDHKLHFLRGSRDDSPRN